MTLSTTQTKVEYLPDGVQTRYAVPFPIFDARDIFCATVNAAGGELPVTAFSVEGIGTEQGVYLRFFTPPTAGRTLVIYRHTRHVQESDYPEGGKFPAVVVETDFDRVVAMIQELQEELDRALKVPITSDKTPEELMEELFSMLDKLEEYWKLIKDAMDQIAGVAGDSIVISSGSTTPRKLADRFADVTNVKDFGAKGNGSADDTTTLKAALAKGGNIYLPPGTYMISSALGIKSNSRIFGGGIGVSVIKMINGVDRVHHCLVSENALNLNARLATDADVEQLVGPYVENATLADFTVDGNAYNRPEGAYADREAGTGIELHKVRNIILENLEVINAPQHNINVRAGTNSFEQGALYAAKHPSQYVWIRSCLVRDQAIDDGITTHDSEYIWIDKCRALLPRNISGQNLVPVSNGIEVDDGSRYVWVTDCYSMGHVCAFQAKGHADSPPAHHVMFDNCTAENAHFGFYLNTGSPIADLSVTEGTCHDITIKNCCAKNIYEFKGMTSWTDQAHYIQLHSCRNVVVENFHITGTIQNMPNAKATQNVFCRFRGYNSRVILDGMSVLAVTERAAGDFIVFEGNSNAGIEIRRIVCDEFSKGFLVRVNGSGIATTITDISLARGSFSFAAVRVAGVGGGNLHVDRIYAPSSQANLLVNDSLLYNRPRPRFGRRWLYGSNTDWQFDGCAAVGDPFVYGQTIGHGFYYGDQSGGRTRIGYAGFRMVGGSGISDAASAWQVYLKGAENPEAFARLSISQASINPLTDSAMDLGTADLRFHTVYASSPEIDTSDAREKRDITEPEEALLRAWGRVRFKTFRFIKAVEEKGEEARVHAGLIAQEIQEAFAQEGLNAGDYGLFCFDAWEERTFHNTVVEREEVLDDDGNILVPAQTRTEVEQHFPAGDRFGVRYAEALALEAAYQRRRVDQLEERLNALNA